LIKSKTFSIAVLIVFASIIVFSCRPVERKPLSYLYTAEYHAHTGLMLLKQGKYSDAEREFQHARALNPQFSLAHSGLSLVNAYRGNFQSAHESMVYALNCAETSEEKVFARICAMRIFTMWRRDEDWLKDVSNQFQRAIELNINSSAAHYFMGVAYKLGLEFDNSGRMFARVLDLNAEYVNEADREWKLIRNVMKAKPATVAGKRVAIKESITRADAAALFVNELKIYDIYERAGIKLIERSPERVTDIDDNPMRADIEDIMAAGVKSLEPYPDGSFRPDDLVTRVMFAMMIEDILKKTASNKSRSPRHEGEASPFPDLKADHPSFSAVMMVTDRGIMEAENLTTGEFSPFSPVSGVEALLIIRKLKESLMYY
jgi:tetratricopeptide (TPR) repeat protein